MRRSAALLVLFVAACDGGSDGGGDTESDSAADASTSASGGSTTSGSSATETTASSMSSGVDPSGSSSGSDPSTTGGAQTSGGSTSEAETSGTGSDSNGGDDGGGSIDVTLTGCDIDFGGTVVVSYNGSLGVASVYDMGASLTGSFQFDLDGPATFALSTQHRVDTGTVVNMVDIGQGTWTNLDSNALPDGPDTIGGTLSVDVWNPSQGEAEITFDGVSLLNITNGNVCTIDGTVIAEELYP